MQRLKNLLTGEKPSTRSKAAPRPVIVRSASSPNAPSTGDADERTLDCSNAQIPVRNNITVIYNFHNGPLPSREELPKPLPLYWQQSTSPAERASPNTPPKADPTAYSAFEHRNKSVVGTKTSRASEMATFYTAHSHLSARSHSAPRSSSPLSGGLVRQLPRRQKGTSKAESWLAAVNEFPQETPYDIDAPAVTQPHDELTPEDSLTFLGVRKKKERSTFDRGSESSSHDIKTLSLPTSCESRPSPLRTMSAPVVAHSCAAVQVSNLYVDTTSQPPQDCEETLSDYKELPSNRHSNGSASAGYQNTSSPIRNSLRPSKFMSVDHGVQPEPPLIETDPRFPEQRYIHHTFPEEPELYDGEDVVRREVEYYSRNTNTYRRNRKDDVIETVNLRRRGRPVNPDKGHYQHYLDHVRDPVFPAPTDITEITETT